MKQTDAFNKAAECERSMRLETDELQKSAYRSLMGLWVALGNNYASISPQQFELEFDDLDQIQTRYQNGKKG
jgi:hypothetical protein